MITNDLIFRPFMIRCSNCLTFITVSIESLDDNEEIICPKCNFVNTPNIDVDKLLKIIKSLEINSIIPIEVE